MKTERKGKKKTKKTHSIREQACVALAHSKYFLLTSLFIEWAAALLQNNEVPQISRSIAVQWRRGVENHFL